MYFLIDTDIGDDIDDALAIALALSLKVNIVGITTVYREADKRADIVKKLLHIVGKDDIPVYVGASKPLSTTAAEIGKLNYSADFTTKSTDDGASAIKFIAECAEKYGEELILFGIGAQTNIARAVMEYPESMKKVGRTVLMGGCFSLPHNEWNIACDPTAAKIVMESFLKPEYVAWDITKDISIGEENLEYILSFQGEQSLRGYVADMVKSWMERNQYCPLLHDPLALIYCFDSSFMEVVEFPSRVVDGGVGDGLIVNYKLYDEWRADYKNAPIVKVVMDADRYKSVKFFMENVFGKNMLLNIKI